MPPSASKPAVGGPPLPIEGGSLSDQGYNPKVVPSQPEAEAAPRVRAWSHWAGGVCGRDSRAGPKWA